MTTDMRTFTGFNATTVITESNISVVDAKTKDSTFYASKSFGEAIRDKNFDFEITSSVGACTAGIIYYGDVAGDLNAVLSGNVFGLYWDGNNGYVALISRSGGTVTYSDPYTPAIGTVYYCKIRETAPAKECLIYSDQERKAEHLIDTLSLSEGLTDSYAYEMITGSLNNGTTLTESVSMSVANLRDNLTAFYLTTPSQEVFSSTFDIIGHAEPATTISWIGTNGAVSGNTTADGNGDFTATVTLGLDAINVLTFTAPGKSDQVVSIKQITKPESYAIIDPTAIKHENDTATIVVTKNKIEYTSDGLAQTSYRKKHPLVGDFEITGNLLSTPDTITNDITYNAFMLGELEYFDDSDQGANYPNDALVSFFIRRDASDNLIIRFYSTASGLTDSADIIISASTQYSWTLTRDNTDIILKLYTDEERTVQHGTTLTIAGDTTTFNWLYPYASHYLNDLDRGYTGYTGDIKIKQNTSIGIKTPDQQTTATSINIAGITSPSSPVNFINSLGGSDSTTSDLDGKYVGYLTLSLGVNAVTVSVSGQADEVINIERVATYTHDVSITTIEDFPTLPVEGVYNMENLFDGLYHQIFYPYAGALSYKLGNTTGNDITFTDRYPVNNPVTGYDNTKFLAIQDTYYSSWHDTMVSGPGGYLFRPVADDVSNPSLLSSYRDGLLGDWDSKANIASVYAEDGYISSLILNGNAVVIKRSLDASSTTSQTTSINVKSYLDDAKELRTRLIEFTNSDLGAVHAYDNALYFAHWDKITVNAEIAITSELFSINDFRVFRDNEDSVYFVYKKIDGSLVFKKLTNLTTLSNEIEICPYVDSFQATCDMSKASAFYVFFSLGGNVYLNSVINSVIGDYNQHVLTELKSGSYLSAPFFEADKIGVQYKNNVGHRKIFTFDTNKAVRSSVGNFVGFCRPDNGFSRLISLKSTDFEKSLVFFQDRSGFGKGSIINHATGELDISDVAITPRYHDLHNRPGLAMLSDKSLWIFHGGSTHELESYPIKMESFNAVFDSPLFDLTSTTAEAVPVLPPSVSYKGFLPIGNDLYFWGAPYSTALVFSRYSNSTWDAPSVILGDTAADPIPETSTVIKYIHGVNVDVNGDMHFGYTQRNTSTPITEFGSTLAIETKYTKVEIAGSVYSLRSSANEVMSAPIYHVDGDRIITKADAPRIESNTYTAGNIVTYNGYLLTCVVGGNTSAETTPIFSYVHHAEIADGSVTWRVDGLANPDYQVIGSMDNAVSSTFTSIGNICFARQLASTIAPYDIEEIFFITIDGTGAWKYIPVKQKSATEIIAMSAPQIYSSGSAIIIFYSLSIDGGRTQLVYQKSDDDGETWGEYTVFAPSEFEQVNLMSTEVVGSEGILSLLWEEKVSTSYTELRSSIVPFTFGSVQITIQDDNGDPVVGATYSIDGAGTYASGEIVPDILVGDRLIAGSDVYGYETFTPFNVTVTDGVTVTGTGVYTFSAIEATTGIINISSLNVAISVGIDISTTLGSISIIGIDANISGVTPINILSTTGIINIASLNTIIQTGVLIIPPASRTFIIPFENRIFIVT